MPEDETEYRGQIFKMLNIMTEKVGSIEGKLDGFDDRMDKIETQTSKACDDVCAVIKYVQITETDQDKRRQLEVLLNGRARRR